MRRTGHRQLGFVFADSPQGGGDGKNSDASENRPWLLHTAKRKSMAGPAARAADPDRLLEEVASEANLARALLNVVRNKGAPVVDGQTVEEAEAQAPRLLADLRHDLLAERFRPGDIRRVWIPKPGGGERGLGIPNVVTRVAQQAILQALEPIYEPSFHPSSHGFRPNRGAHTAIAEATGYLEAGFRIVVDLDLAKFLDASSHCTSRFFERSEEVWSNCRYLNSYAFCPSAIDVNSLELATLYTLQDRLPRDTE